MKMKKVYENVREKIGDNYFTATDNFYNKPFEFAEELIGNKKFTLCYTPQSYRSYPEYDSTDLFSILVNNHIEGQFLRQYNRNENFMILEEVNY